MADAYVDTKMIVEGNAGEMGVTIEIISITLLCFLIVLHWIKNQAELRKANVAGRADLIALVIDRLFELQSED